MSPASKSKSKEKKVAKDAQKASSRSAASVSANSSMPASAYNPLLGTFQVLDSAPASLGLPLNNGRFRSIDEADVTGVESDSVSNNGSWSGESEDHKEKTSNPPSRQESIPGADNDKREKIRQKNERKHQRQKERRAQELHERCSTYLMSRKLEALTQQLVAMGISQEHATKALMLNDGKVEESVHWLFDRCEEEVEKQSTQSPGNLKIDITEELARITDMEIRYKCTKQEVERAVVAAEGDLDRAEETLKSQKQDQSYAPAKQEESADPSIASNGKHTIGIAYQNSAATAAAAAAARQQVRPVPSPALQQTRDEKDFNYMRSSLEPLNKMMVQPLKRPQPKLEWPKPQQTAALADRRWPSSGPSSTASLSMASPLHVSPPPVKVEARYAAGGNELKNLHQPSNREPITMMQRTQVANTKQIPPSSISSSPPGTSTSWYPTTSIEIMKSNGFTPLHIPSTRSPSPNNLNPSQIYQQLQYQQQQRFGNNLGDSSGIARSNGLWTRNTASPTVAAASSLGLFSGLGSTGTSGASSPVDWSTGGSMAHLDYTSVDWSLDRGVNPNARHNGFWPGSTPPLKNTLMFDPNTNPYALKASMGARINSNGVPMVGLENGGVGVAGEASTGNSRDWTSPFAGKDLFSLSRQYVSSPL